MNPSVATWNLSRPDQKLIKRVVSCTHCGLGVPNTLVRADRENQFCCPGCESVYHVLTECGLEQYYQLRDRDPGRPAPALSTGNCYEAFNHEVFINTHTQLIGEHIRRVELFLEGLHCAACAWLVEKLPMLVPGVLNARLELSRGILTVAYDERVAQLQEIARQLDRLGYPPHPAHGVETRALRRTEERTQLIRLGIAGALAGNVMLIGLALYAGDWDGMEHSFVQWFRGLSALLGSLSLLWPGRIFFTGAWSALRTRTPHLDIPIALGLGAGGIAGVYNTLIGSGELYFDSLCVLVFLLLVGRYIQRRQQNNADEAVEALFSLTPLTARRIINGQCEEIPVAALQINDCVEVRAGESIPADGVITNGNSSVDQAILTGESAAVVRAAGDLVCAGTVNISAPLQIRVLATGETTRVGKLLRWVSECARDKAPAVLLANQIAGWFTVIVLGLSGLTYSVWTWGLHSPKGADYAIALLIVACPCALGLATPLAVAVALGRAAQRGILIKGGEALEHLARPGILFLDKTGTLTRGKATVLKWTGPDELKPLVAALEENSTHPTAKALSTAFAEQRNEVEVLKVDSIRQNMNGGIEGRVNGRMLQIGSQKFLERLGVEIPGWAVTEVLACLSHSEAPVFIAEDNRVRAVAGLGDEIKPGTKAVLDRLRNEGWRLGILSGDHPAIVQEVARSLGIPESMAFGSLLPEDKLAKVLEFQKSGPVIMVGDGVNDAAALSAATVGIAVHGGAEASLAAAPVYLSRPGLLDIAELSHASRQTVKAVRRCLVASLFYNALAVSLAGLGLIHPLLAAILMPVSSITVLSLSFGSQTFGARS